MLPSLIVKAGLTKVAEKAFDKVGGVKGIKEKGQKLANSTKEHAGNIAKAVKEKDVEKVAEAVGTVAKDVTEVAKDAGKAAVEIGTETIQETKSQIEEIKKVIKGNDSTENKPPNQNKPKSNDGFKR